MNKFKVSEIINTSTIEVASGWVWKTKGVEETTYKGRLVKIRGIDVPKSANSLALERLKTLLLNQEVSLTNTSLVEANNDNSIIECSVMFNGIDISYYFPEYKKT